MSKTDEVNFNRVDSATLKTMNLIEAKINLIKNNTGYGNLIISIYDKKVTNIKTTISEDIK